MCFFTSAEFHLWSLCCCWWKLLPAFQQVRELHPSCIGRYFQQLTMLLKSEWHYFHAKKRWNKAAAFIWFLTPVFFFLFVVVFFSWHVQYVNRSYKYLIFHLFNKRHAKHKTAKFLQGSEILGVLKFRAAAAAGTCIMRVLSTPAGLWIPPGPIILVCLFFLTTSSV